MYLCFLLPLYTLSLCIGTFILCCRTNLSYISSAIRISLLFCVDQVLPDSFSFQISFSSFIVFVFVCACKEGQPYFSRFLFSIIKAGSVIIFLNAIESLERAWGFDGSFQIPSSRRKIDKRRSRQVS